jgi:hypothetical protein
MVITQQTLDGLLAWERGDQGVGWRFRTTIGELLCQPGRSFARLGTRAHLPILGGRKLVLLCAVGQVTLVFLMASMRAFLGEFLYFRRWGMDVGELLARGFPSHATLLHFFLMAFVPIFIVWVVTAGAIHVLCRRSWPVLRFGSALAVLSQLALLLTGCASLLWCGSGFVPAEMRWGLPLISVIGYFGMPAVMAGYGSALSIIVRRSVLRRGP